MRMIDEKGRILGLINVIDLAIIGAIAIAAFFSFRWIQIARDPSWVRVDFFHASCVGVAEMPSGARPGVPAYIAVLIRDGDEAYNAEGIVVGRIAKVLGDRPIDGPTYVSRDGEKIFFAPDAREVTVEVDLLAYRKKGRTYPCITNVPLRVGDKITMNTEKYAIVVDVRSIPDAGER